MGFPTNQTFSGSFDLLGLTYDHSLSAFLFLLFLLIYTLAIVGNTGIIILFRVVPSLRIPMYFFLSHLSFTDLCYSSIITPKLLDNLIVGDTTILYSTCMLQLVLFSVFGSLESLILGLMSCDRCVAISRPLKYHYIMTELTCRQLIGSCYTMALVTSLLNALYALKLRFCDPVRINHFYCDYPPLLKTACSDTSVNELVLMASVTCISGTSVVTIVISYSYITYIVLGIRSTEGRRKIFYTCSSHLTVVLMFYGTIMFMYLRPGAQYFTDQDKVVAVFYTVVIPALNPVIYSMRNKEIQFAVHKVARQINNVW